MSTRSFMPTIAMLQFAATERKAPAMVFRTDRGKRLRLVYNRRTTLTKVILDDVMIGSLKPNGTLTLTSLGDVWPDWLSEKDYLFRLLQDPLQAAKTSAAITGICTFCGRELTDPRSKSVGYGPKCAETWNLPWGGSEPLPDNLEELFL